VGTRSSCMQDERRARGEVRRSMPCDGSRRRCENSCVVQRVSKASGRASCDTRSAAASHHPISIVIPPAGWRLQNAHHPPHLREPALSRFTRSQSLCVEPFHPDGSSRHHRSQSNRQDRHNKARPARSCENAPREPRRGLRVAATFRRANRRRDEGGKRCRTAGRPGAKYAATRSRGG